MLRPSQALDKDQLVGVVVGKLEAHRGGPLRGYIAMLAVKEQYRGNGIGELLRSLYLDHRGTNIDRSNQARPNGDRRDDGAGCRRSRHFYELMTGMTANKLQVALETEITNTAAIKLYERLGFLRSKRLHRYYFNGNSAFRLVLYLKPPMGTPCLDDIHGVHE
jgi:peptide alpha-N-acetyltransferase